MSTSNSSLEFYYSLRSCIDPSLSPVIQESLNILEDSIRLYGHANIFASYNGGKDADVVLHLLKAAWSFSFHQKQICDHCLTEDSSTEPHSPSKDDAHLLSDKHDNVSHLELIYFQSEGEFPEVLEHIDTNERLLHLNIKRFNCGIQEGLKSHLENRPKDQGHAAFILGTRHGDPNCKNQGVFAPSSSWMPIPFMRVNPIINWNYSQVWKFLKLYNLSYCCLYDLGYTSLGITSNTLPNPYLKNNDGTYKAAIYLENWDEERAGRVKVNSCSSSSTSPPSLSSPCLSTNSSEY